MEACQRPASSIQYESPLSNDFVFLDRLVKSDDGLDKLYDAVNFVATFFIPEPHIPRSLLAPELLSNPVDHLPQALTDALRELPRMTYLVTGAISLALVFPLFGLSLLTCRFCCGACGGRTDVFEKKYDSFWRCVCFFSLGTCCAFMTFACGCAIIANMYTHAGISSLPSYPKRVIQDVETGYLKTQHEIDTLFLTDYAIFEAEMKDRLQNCAKIIGEDIEGILAVNPVLLAKKLVNHIVNMTTEAQVMKLSSDQYLAATSAVATQILFEPGKSAVAKVIATCSTLQTNVDLCDAIKSAKANLQAQSSNFAPLTDLGKAMANYSEMLNTLNAAQFQPVVDKASNPTAKDDFMKAVNAGVNAAKDYLQKLGDDYGDTSNTFYIEPLEFPEDIMTAVDKRIIGKYRKFRPYVLAFSGFNAALVGLLLVCPTTLYVCGLCVVAWAPARGRCTYRSGRWCFSLGAFVFVLLFGFAVLLALAGLVAAFMTTRCGCALAADLKQAGVAAVVRYLVQLVQIRTDDDSVASKLVTSVSSDYLLDVTKRFGSCHTEPRSAYRLLGEPFVRNASKAIGCEKLLSILWEGFDEKPLDAQLEFIGGSVGSIVNPSQLSALATTLEPLKHFELQALKIQEIETKVEGISTKGDYAEELKTALDALARQTTELTDAIKDVDKIHTDLLDCDLKKKVLQDSLTKMKGLMEVDGKTVDVFKSEAIVTIGDTKKLQDAIDKVNHQVQPYKQTLANVVQSYGEYVINQMRDVVGNCAPAYTIYLSSVSVVCDGVVKPFSGFWLCVASFIAVGMVAMFMALCMSTLYSRKPRPPKATPTESVPVPKQRMEIFAVSVRPHPREPSKIEIKERVPKRVKTRKVSIAESEPSTSSCSCIFSDSSTYSPKPTTAPPRSRRTSSRSTKESRVEKATDSGNGIEGIVVVIGRARRKKKMKGEEIDAITIENEEDDSNGKQKKRKSSKKQTNNAKAMAPEDDAQKKNKKTKKQAQKEKKDASHNQSSTTDVRLLLHEPPTSGIARAFRTVSRRVTSFGRSPSSVLQSISGSVHSLSTRLFRRYQTVDDDMSSYAALQ
ncbi:uncharacterized protein [Dermacentor albipictus]|uniref:uncharacterized protein isoform X1 n=1 Tax=Dermacentor albipictus TaxID=60249 RepID=UPI0038FC3961